MILTPRVKSVPHAVPSPLNVSREEAGAAGGNGAEGNGGEGDSAPRADWSSKSLRGDTASRGSDGISRRASFSSCKLKTTEGQAGQTTSTLGS
jgi:hypothetical protein